MVLDIDTIYNKHFDISKKQPPVLFPSQGKRKKATEDNLLLRRKICLTFICICNRRQLQVLLYLCVLCVYVSVFFPVYTVYLYQSVVICIFEMRRQLVASPENLSYFFICICNRCICIFSSACNVYFYQSTL